MTRRRILIQALANLPLVSVTTPLFGATFDKSEKIIPKRIALPELTEGSFEEFVHAKYGTKPIEQSLAIKFSVPANVENAGLVPATVWIDQDERDWHCTAMTIYSECARQEPWPQPSYRFYTYQILTAKLIDVEPYLSFHSRLYNPPAAIAVVATLSHRNQNKVRFLYNKSITMRYRCGDGCSYFGIEHSHEDATGP